MNKKLLLWIPVFLINIASVLAEHESTLFASATGTRFLTFGVFIVILFVIVSELIKTFRGKK